MVTRKNGYNVPQFRSTRRTKQEGLISATKFNVAVDNVVHHWLSMIVEDGAVIHNGMGHVVG